MSHIMPGEPGDTNPAARQLAKQRLRAAASAERSLPASERLANTLRATHSTPDVNAILAQLRAEFLAEAIAAVEAKRLAGESDTLIAHGAGITDAIAAINALAAGGSR